MRNYDLNYYFEVTDTEINESADLKEQLKTIIEIVEHYKKYEKKIKVPPVSVDMRETFYKKLNAKKNQIELQIETGTLNSTNQQNYNWYPHIFITTEHYMFFKKLQEEIVEDSTQLADYSFIYTKMKRDGYLHNIKHKTFIEFLNSPEIGASIEADQLKSNISDKNIGRYSSIKSVFKL